MNTSGAQVAESEELKATRELISKLNMGWLGLPRRDWQWFGAGLLILGIILLFLIQNIGPIFGMTSFQLGFLCTLTGSLTLLFNG